MGHIESLLRDLFAISKLGTFIFELGGVAADVERTARDMADLILGTTRVRLARSADMDAIYLMGFDVWGEGQSQEEYLGGCRSSSKYAKGTWYVLEDSHGQPVSALITYKLAAVNGNPAIGIGSIATAPNLRTQGHAGKLIWDVMMLCHDRDGSQVFYLYADIKPEYYESFDFVRLPEMFQTKPGSVLMIRASNEMREGLLRDPTFRPPSYF